MKKFYIIVGVMAVAAIGGSIMLLPDSDQLHFMSNAKTEIKDESAFVVLQQKRDALEKKMAEGALDSETVSELADTYVGLQKVEKALEVMEKYHKQNPKDIRMLDKLGILYHLAGQDANYVAILEEENEVAPSANNANILLQHYSILYGTTRPEKSIKIARQLIKLQPENPEHYKTLTYFLLMPGQNDAEVIEALRDFRKHFPDLIDYNFTFPLVDRLVKAGNFDEAYEISSSWLKKHTETPPADMAQMFYNAHRPDLTLKLLNEHSDIIHKDPAVFLLYTRATMATKPSEGYPLAVEWMKGHPEDMPMLEKLGSMLFNEKRYSEVMKLLEPYRQEVGYNPALKSLYDESANTSLRADLTGDPQKALQVTQERLKAHPDDLKALEDIGVIFFAAKRYQEIVKLYQPYRDKILANPILRDIYRESLIATVKQHPENRAQLTYIFEEELKKPQTTPARRKQLLYGMLDTGAGMVALPYARKYAFEMRGDWVYLYEGFLKKLGQTRELADFRNKYIHTVQLTDKERHYFISIYLDEGNKTEAVRMLWQLAENKPAQDENVQLLLYLWGISPGPKEVAWIEQRAVKAEGEEKGRWLQVLMNVRAYDAVIRVASAMPPQARSPKVWEQYVAALQFTKNKKRLVSELASAIQTERNEQSLAYYSKAAREQGAFAVAGDGYDRLIDMNPSNIEYFKERGMTAYYQGKLETAKNYLDEYYARGGNDATALFYFAELLLQRSAAQARPLFEETVIRMERNPNLTLDEQVIKIHCLARLHRYKQAKSEMEELLKKHPDNAYLKLDYIEFLIDTKEYDNAESRLVHALDMPKATLMSELWRVNKGHITRIEKTVNPYELLLRFDRATDKLKEVKQLQSFHPEWITAVYPGYDTVLLVGRPQAELGYTTEGNVIIIEGRQFADTKANADPSLPIRRQLLQARVEQETHRNRDALNRLYQLKKLYPEDVGVTTGLAISERASGRRLVAMDLANEAHMREPENRWINILLADLKKDDQPYVRLDYQWQHLAGNDQFIPQLSGLAPVTRNLKLGAGFDSDFYRYKGLQRADGSIGNGAGNEQRGELDALYEFESGELARTALYFNEGSQGIGENITTRNKLGTANIYGELNRSDWTFTERLADHVTRNRIGALQTYSPEPEVYSYFGGGMTAYSQDQHDDVTDSVSLSGGINGPVGLFNTNWTTLPVTVGYGLDAEYVTSRDLGTSAAGNTYRLYPLVSREVHYVYGNYRHSFSENLTGDATLGYAYDRMTSDSGPSIALNLIKQIDEHVEAQFRISHGISFTQSGEGATNASGHLLYKFQP